jgi:hypothetical protein
MLRKCHRENSTRPVGAGLAPPTAFTTIASNLRDTGPQSSNPQTMKNVDSLNANVARLLCSCELTRVLPVWNHPRIVGVAQALLPVRFSGKCKLLPDAQLGLDCDPGESLPKHCVFAK